jgi:hypothetical protein
MESRHARAVGQGLWVEVNDLPDGSVWHAAVERLHRLTLRGLGDDVAAVRVELSGVDDINCRLSVRLRRVQRGLRIETRHSDGALALIQAFTRAQREAQRRLNARTRFARRAYLGEGAL